MAPEWLAKAALSHQAAAAGGSEENCPLNQAATQPRVAVAILLLSAPRTKQSARVQARLSHRQKQAMESLLTIALAAARAAGRNLARGMDRLDRVRVLEAAEESFATSMDADAEHALIHQIRKFYPNHQIESRLSGDCGGEDGSIRWLLEPLAGSRNCFAGLPWFGVAVACRVKGALQNAAIVLPQLQEEFTASRGGGAQLNARRIRTAADSHPRGRLIALHDSARRRQVAQAMRQTLHGEAALIRQSGCAVFDIAQTAAGRLQGGWCGESAGIGTQAAGLVLREAGGLLVGERGQPEIADATELLYGNPRMVRELARLRGGINAGKD